MVSDPPARRPGDRGQDVLTVVVAAEPFSVADADKEVGDEPFAVAQPADRLVRRLDPEQDVASVSNRSDAAAASATAEEHRHELRSESVQRRLLYAIELLDLRAAVRLRSRLVFPWSAAVDIDQDA